MSSWRPPALVLHLRQPQPSMGCCRIWGPARPAGSAPLHQGSQSPPHNRVMPQLLRAAHHGCRRGAEYQIQHPQQLRACKACISLLSWQHALQSSCSMGLCTEGSTVRFTDASGLSLYYCAEEDSCMLCSLLMASLFGCGPLQQRHCQRCQSMQMGPWGLVKQGSHLRVTERLYLSCGWRRTSTPMKRPPVLMLLATVECVASRPSRSSRAAPTAAAPLLCSEGSSGSGVPSTGASSGTGARPPACCRAGPSGLGCCCSSTPGSHTSRSHQASGSGRRDPASTQTWLGKKPCHCSSRQGSMRQGVASRQACMLCDFSGGACGFAHVCTSHMPQGRLQTAIGGLTAHSTVTC